MQNVAFIINPFSSKGNYHQLLSQLNKKIENPIVYISDSIDGTYDFIKNNFEAIAVFVAIGGDGTISTVASCINNTDKILAVLPAGSGNGFALETHFTENLEDLIFKLKAKKFKKIDTFLINNQLSINVSGIGFDGAVVEAFEKTSRGFLNYIQTCIKMFSSFKPFQVSFQNKYKEYNGEYLMINFANSRQFGNNTYIAPHADMSDGLLEIILIKKFPFYYAAFFAYLLFTKKLVSSAYVHFISTSEIQFTSASELWHLDGEFKRISSPIVAKIIPLSLNILQ